MKLTGAFLTATALTVTVAACGGTSPAASRTPADQHLCTAAASLKRHAGVLTALAVVKAGKNATGPLRGDVEQFAEAAIHGPQSAVTTAERKLYGDCGI